MPLTRTERLHEQLLELRPAAAGMVDAPNQMNLPLAWKELPDRLERFITLHKQLFLTGALFTQSVQISWEDSEQPGVINGPTSYIVLDRIVQHEAAKGLNAYMRSRVTYRFIPSPLYDSDYGAILPGRHIAITRSSLHSDRLVADEQVVPLMETLDAVPYYNTLRVEPCHEITDLAMVVRTAATGLAQQPESEA